MQAFEIPLSSVAQIFTVSLSSVTYKMRIVWCEPAQHWVLDIADVSEVPVVQGLPLVPYLNLLEQLEYLGFGGMLVVQSQPDAQAIPGLTNLGEDGLLFYVTP